MNCVGVFDVLTFDNSQTNHLALMPQYQVLFNDVACLVNFFFSFSFLNGKFLHMCTSVCVFCHVASGPSIAGQGGAGTGM